MLEVNTERMRERRVGEKKKSRKVLKTQKDPAITEDKGAGTKKNKEHLEHYQEKWGNGKRPKSMCNICID